MSDVGRFGCSLVVSPPSGAYSVCRMEWKSQDSLLSGANAIFLADLLEVSERRIRVS